MLKLVLLAVAVTLAPASAPAAPLSQSKAVAAANDSLIELVQGRRDRCSDKRDECTRRWPNYLQRYRLCMRRAGCSP